MEKVHTRPRTVAQVRIDQILEITLALWAETERMQAYVSVKPRRRSKRKDYLMPNVTLDNAIAQLKQAVSESLAASEALIASHAAGTLTDADVAPIGDAAAALKAETAKVLAAIPTTP